MASLRGTVYQRVNRPAPSVIEAAQHCTSADVYDMMGKATACTGIMQPGMRPLKLAQKKAIGPAITASSFPGDNLMVHRALSLAEPGDVLVVNSSWSAAAQWGINAAVWARARGLAGVIIDGAVRDAAALAEMDPPVWCTTISPGGPVRQSAGGVNLPISCSGVVVNPGDLIVADGDGVIAVPRLLAAEVIEGVRAHMAAGAAERERLANAGPALYERRDYDKILRELGVEEIDRAWDDRAD